MGERLRDDAIDLTSFLESVFVSPPTRCRGTAVFLVSDQGLTPNALLHNLKHNKVLHERNLFVTVRHHEVPWIAERQALRDRGARPRLLAGDAALRLQERARRARGARARCAPRGCVVEDMDTSLLPVARHRHPDPRRRHGRLAREALRRHAPQRAAARRLPAPADQRVSSSSARRSRSERSVAPSSTSLRVCATCPLRRDRRLRRRAGRLHQLGGDRVPGGAVARRHAGAGRPRGCGRSAGAWACARCCPRSG